MPTATRVRLHQQLTDYCSAITDTRHPEITNPDRRHNAGPALFEIFVWQEMKKLASSRLEKAWEAAVDEGLVKEDKVLRALGPGEHIVAESNVFSCLIKVKAPRQSIDKDKFVAAVARKARISEEKVLELWEQNCKESAAPLEKRVLEV